MRESLDQASAQVSAHTRQSSNLAGTESPNEHANQIRCPDRNNAEYALPVDDKLPGERSGTELPILGRLLLFALNADAPACCRARCGWFRPGRPYRKRERPTPVPVPAMCGETLDEGALIQRACQDWRPGEGRGNGRRRPPARMPAPVGYPAAP